MKESHGLRLLAIDSAINLGLGAALLLFLRTTISLFGLPASDTSFYVTLLGAVLVGIGIALWLERRDDDRWRGLGLAGAVVINMLGAGTVFVWLFVDPFDIPLRGYFVLWSVGIVVFGTALVELVAMFRARAN